ncbi:hypothetical protein J6590_084817, partial [Homalodisca vitripennis]
FGPSGRQEQEVSCWNLAGTSQIVIQFCNEEYDRGKRYSLKSRADGGFRNPRPRLDIVQLTEAITVGRTNSRICRLEVTKSFHCFCFGHLQWTKEGPTGSSDRRGQGLGFKCGKPCHK